MTKDMLLGRFELDEADVRAMGANTRRVMREVIVISVQLSPMCGRMEYMALSDLFRPVALGEKAPMYVFTLDNKGIKAVEQEPKARD